MNHENRAAEALDGNAAAGLLSDVFAFEATIAQVTCRGCGATAEIGEMKVYGGAMGAIFRCARCDTVIIRLVRTSRAIWLDMHGANGFCARLKKDGE